jgi:autotransporter-associated beta strand protein
MKTQLILLALGATLATTTQGQTLTTTAAGSDPLWNAPANWSPATVPNAIDAAAVWQIEDTVDGDVLFTNDAGTVTLGSLSINNLATSGYQRIYSGVGTGGFRFETSSGNAMISLSGDRDATINAKFRFQSDTDISTTSLRTLTLISTSASDAVLQSPRVTAGNVVLNRNGGDFHHTNWTIGDGIGAPGAATVTTGGTFVFGGDSGFTKNLVINSDGLFTINHTQQWQADNRGGNLTLKSNAQMVIASGQLFILRNNNTSAGTGSILRYTGTSSGAAISGDGTLNMSSSDTTADNRWIDVAFGFANEADLTISAAISGDSTGKPSANFFKTGPGTLVLSSDSNLISGNFRVENGRVIADGANATGTGVLTVDSTKTFGGTGSHGGPATINGNIEPGSINLSGDSTQGNLTIEGDVTLSGSAQLKMQIISGTQFDSLTLNGAGTNTLAGSASLIFGNPFTENASIDIIPGTAVLSGDFSSVTASGAYTGSFTDAGSNLWTLDTGDGGSLEFDSSTGVLSITAPPTSGPVIEGVYLPGSGEFQVTVRDSKVGYDYTLQSSTGLSGWTDVGTEPGTGADIVFTSDGPTAPENKVFYQVDVSVSPAAL